MAALAGQRVTQVACGSRDAQTLCLTEDGKVYSWGDGDFGKLGRGGSDGCSIPRPIDRLHDQDVIKIGEQHQLSKISKLFCEPEICCTLLFGLLSNCVGVAQSFRA